MEREDRSRSRDRGGFGEDRKAKLFVGGLGSEITKSDLEKAFSEFGTITDLHLKEKPGANSFAFVEFRDTREAEEAIQKLNRTTLKESNISVSFAKPRQPRGEGGDRGGGRMDRSMSNDREENNFGGRGGDRFGGRGNFDDQRGGDRGYGGGDRNFGGGDRGGGDRPKGCFNCGEVGHMSRECTQCKVRPISERKPMNRGGGGGGNCFNCGQTGHFSRECPQEKKPFNRGPRDDYGGNNSRQDSFRQDTGRHDNGRQDNGRNNHNGGTQDRKPDVKINSTGVQPDEY